MKFTLAIFAAVLCATAVAGAPSTPNLSFEELISSNQFGFGDQLRKYWLDKDCVKQILAKETSNEFKALWGKYYAKLEKVHDEWNKCKSISNIADKLKCKAVVIEKSAEIYSEFFSKLIEVVDLQKAKEIGMHIVTKCLEHNAFNELEDAEEFAAGSLPEQFQCLVDVVGDVSKNNGLEELWSKSQPELQLYLDTWKECANVDSQFAKILCNIKEGVATYRIINDYLRLVASQKPALVSQIVREVQEKCSTLQSIEDILDLDELDFDNMSLSIIDEIQCVTTAITRALKDTDFEKPWANLLKDLEKLAERLAACRYQSTLLDIAKCIIRESQSTKSVIERFLKNIEKVNKDLYDRVRKYIKQLCH